MGHDDVKKLLHASFVGDLKSDFFSYANPNYKTPQILTKVTLPGGSTSVLVENLQVVDDPSDRTIADSRISRLKTEKVMTNNTNLRKRFVASETPQLVKEDRDYHTGDFFGSQIKMHKKRSKNSKYDVLPETPKHKEKKILKKKTNWRQICCCCMRKPKKTTQDLNRTTYSDDQFSKTLGDTSRYYRGNLLILLCDVMVVFGLAIIAIVVYYALDLEWDNTVSPQTLAAVFGLFKLSKGFSGLIGYANIIWHDTIYRGDIVEIIGTWNSIGGKVVGVVYKVTVADVYLLTNQPFMSHFAANKTATPTPNKNTLPSPEKKDTFQNASSISIQSTNSSNDTIVHRQSNDVISEMQHDDSPITETIHRYITVNTAYRIPNIKARMLCEDEKRFAKKTSKTTPTTRKERDVYVTEHIDHAERGARPLFSKQKSKQSKKITQDDHIMIEMDDDNMPTEEWVGYVKLHQDISGGTDKVPMQVKRFSETVDTVRLNTNAVYLASIYTKIGWNTNLKITF
jgi:hypothetical protein